MRAQHPRLASVFSSVAMIFLSSNAIIFLSLSPQFLSDHHGTIIPLFMDSLPIRRHSGHARSLPTTIRPASSVALLRPSLCTRSARSVHLITLKQLGEVAIVIRLLLDLCRSERALCIREKERMRCETAKKNWARVFVTLLNLLLQWSNSIVRLVV